MKGLLEKRNEIYEENRLFYKKWKTFFVVIQGNQMKFFHENKVHLKIIIYLFL